MEILDIHKYIKNDREEIANPSPYTRYYLERFANNLETSWFISWNWSAFFVPLLWFSHRKMYVYLIVWFLACYFLAYYSIIFASLFLGVVTDLYWFIAILAELVMRLFLGLYGNAIYLRDLRGRVANNSNRIGTSEWAPLLIMIISFCLFALGVVFF